MKYKSNFGKELELLLTKIAPQKTLFHEFLQDLLSPSEYKDLAIRWQIIKLLDRKISQREIAKKLGVGIATITRGSRELSNPRGGFSLILKKL